MNDSPQHRGRPLAEAASDVITHDDTSKVAQPDDTTVRCRRCRHPLTADISVSLELGPVCRHLLGAAA